MLRPDRGSCTDEPPSSTGSSATPNAKRRDGANDLGSGGPWPNPEDGPEPCCASVCKLGVSAVGDASAGMFGGGLRWKLTLRASAPVAAPIPARSSAWLSWALSCCNNARVSGRSIMRLTCTRPASTGVVMAMVMCPSDCGLSCRLIRVPCPSCAI